MCCGFYSSLSWLNGSTTAKRTSARRSRSGSHVHQGNSRTKLQEKRLLLPLLRLSCQRMTSFASPLPTAEIISQAIANNDGMIARADLEEFFSVAASSFGQESDGKSEAVSLIRLLSPKENDADEDGDGIVEIVFSEYLSRRFSSHPSHLDELASVAKTMKQKRLATNNTDRVTGDSIDTSGTTADKAVPTSAVGSEENKEGNEELRERVARLQKKIAAQDAKMKEITTHHQRVLGAALAAARVERSKALKSGLAELTEKVKRLSTERLKREAQISRLRMQVSNAKSENPIVSPSVSRSRRSPGRLSSPGRVRPQMSTHEDTFEPPPAIGERIHSISRLQESPTQSSPAPGSEPRISSALDSGKSNNMRCGCWNRKQRWWEDSVLGDGFTQVTGEFIDLASSSAFQLYHLSKKEMEVLSQISIGCVEDVSMSASGGGDRDASSFVERAAAVVSLRASAMQYHAEQAILLASHAASRAAASKDRTLRARCFLQMANVLDVTHDLKSAMQYAEQAAQLYDVLGMGARAASAMVYVMILSCEMQDLDKAEIMAMKLKGSEAISCGVRQSIGDHLDTIRSAIEHNMRIKVERERGWPCKVTLDLEK